MLFLKLLLKKGCLENKYKNMVLLTIFFSHHNSLLYVEPLLSNDQLITFKKNIIIVICNEHER